MIHFGIIHAVHRTESTLPRCIASLHAAGAESIEVFPDNGTFGAFHNWNRAICRLIEKAGERDQVCVVDDDFVVCKDALVWLANNRAPDQVHTLYTPEQNIPHNLRQERGWVYVPVGWGSWGGMIVMPRDIASKMVRHAFYRRYYINDQKGHQIDAVPYETLRLMGNEQVWHHLPSLADHIGAAASTLGNDHAITGGFRFTEWQ